MPDIEFISKGILLLKKGVLIGSSASGDGKFIVRLIGDRKPEGKELEGTRATLEDVYLKAFED